MTLDYTHTFVIQGTSQYVRQVTYGDDSSQNVVRWAVVDTDTGHHTDMADIVAVVLEAAYQKAIIGRLSALVEQVATWYDQGVATKDIVTLVVRAGLAP